MRDQVRQRCVFYISGFDPKGAAHYHALYRDEAAKQATVNGLDLAVGPRLRKEGGHASWHIGLGPTDAAPAGVRTEYQFLRWDDLVRAHWPRDRRSLWRDVVRTTLFNLRRGSLWRMANRSWPPALALFLPFLTVLFQVAGAHMLALGLAVALSLAGLSWWAAAGGAAAAWAVLWGGTMVLERRYAMYWMMRSYSFTRLQALGRVPGLEERLDAFAAAILERWRHHEDDEILLVGHSTGSIMAVAALGRAIAQEPELAHKGTRVSLLTLGQWIPLLGLIPEARSFRAELGTVARSGLAWVDFSAPPDGCCFALSDPCSLCGVDPGLTGGPKLLNPRFAQLFPAARYQALRHDKFDVHFQYLKAGELAGAYDYFAITGGPLSLAERYREWPSVTDYRGLVPPWVRPETRDASTGLARLQ